MVRWKMLRVRRSIVEDMRGILRIFDAVVVGRYYSLFHRVLNTFKMDIQKRGRRITCKL